MHPIDDQNTYPSSHLQSSPPFPGIPGQPPTPHRVSTAPPRRRRRPHSAIAPPRQPHSLPADDGTFATPRVQGLHNTDHAPCHGGSAGSRPRRGLASKEIQYSPNKTSTNYLHSTTRRDWGTMGGRMCVSCHAIVCSPGRLAGGRYLTGLVWRLLGGKHRRPRTRPSAC